MQALTDVSLDVNQQEKIVICGPSGSGKSTLIRCINRPEEHQEGQIVVDGNEISEKTKDIEKIRAEVGMVFQQFNLFEAAYMAEVIRGGLQALPRGQYDAAKSLGMGYWRLHLLVILPQALKLVIPGIANTFLALVKDTPLIFVVGLLELAGMIGLAKTNPKWLGMAIEGYVFAGLVFWVICYAMSRYSQRLEKRLSTER